MRLYLTKNWLLRDGQSRGLGIRMLGRLLGLTLIFLTLSGASCSTPPPQVVHDKTPKALLIHTETATALDTAQKNGDLLGYALEARSAIMSCNGDKDLLRDYFKDIKEPDEGSWFSKIFGK